MRFYRVKFKNTDGTMKSTAPYQPKTVPYVYESHSKEGVLNPGALNIEFDVNAGFLHIVRQQSRFRIYNPPREVLQNTNVYQGMIIEVSAGFLKGLPLANTQPQPGIIFTGVVANSFGNLLGTEIVLDMILAPSENVGNPNPALPSGLIAYSPRSYAFEWNPQQDMVLAITQTLKNAGYTVVNQTTTKVQANFKLKPFASTYSSIQDFADFVNAKSKEVVNAATPNQKQEYYGINMSDGVNKNEIILTDNAKSGKEINIPNADFIGQPTWLQYPKTIQSQHPMRSDIVVNSVLKYPKNIPNTISQTNPFTPSQQIIRGVERVQATIVKHTGNYRDPGYQSWCTTVTSTNLAPVQE